MELLQKIWPYSLKERTEVSQLVIAVVVYLVVGIVGSVVLTIAGLLTVIPVVGALLAIVLKLVGSLLELYVLVGIILVFLVYFKVLK